MEHEIFLKQYADKTKPKELWKAWNKGQRGGSKWDIWMVWICLYRKKGGFHRPNSCIVFNLILSSTVTSTNF